ncbi:putative transporter [Hyphodiscus hymeniophilus]|uniref:Transporter n=1 Tax=Hyphodiscus hymeniophilus TaxID=353542 RepID=A0A9P6VSD3_9HELO|nr:putative transporter [Hyphodiscus hymeniophilus]
MAAEKATITEVPNVDSYEPTGKLEKEFGEGQDALDSSAQVLATTSYEYTESDAKAVRWKIDRRLMPVLLITGMLSAIDKIIISNAALYGLKKDLHLSSGQYSWVGSIVSFGNLVAEWPGAYCVHRYPLSKVMGIMVILWGVFACLTAAANNFSTLMALRFLLGFCEGPVFPGCEVYVVMFYKGKEQPLRIAIYLASIATLFIGPLSYGIGRSTGVGIETWKLLYITVGGVTLFWGIALFWLLPDNPATWKFLSEREKYIALDRVRENHTGVENKHIKWGQVREAFLDPKSWVLLCGQIMVCTFLGGLTNFAALIVNNLGFSPLQTVLLGMPTGCIQFFSSIALSYIGTIYPNTRCIVASLACLIPLAGTALIWKLPTSNKFGRLGVYYVIYLFWGSYTLSASLPAANTSGHSKKVTTYAMTFVGYTTGLIIGPQYFSKNFTHGYIALMCSAAAACVLFLLYALICIWQNKQKDKAVAAGKFDNIQHNLSADLLDLTDTQKRDFRYIY